MHCPNCGKSFDVGNQCPHCKIDVVLFKGTEDLSYRLYNKGLERLHSMDFTHGIQELSRSIAVNKHNVRARNLLGLALFEIGHIGEALKHWVISQSHLKENNPAKEYLEAINKNTRTFERLNEAVLFYNRALEYLRQNNDDLAVIQLKKSLEHNPRFLDAMNLLTLCYLQQRNRQQANATMERVLTIDARNPIALHYYAILNPAQPRPESSRGRVNVKQPTPPPPATEPAPPAGPRTGDTGPFKTIAIKEKKTTYFHAVGILSFIVGAACMLAFGFFLYLPGIERGHNIALRYAQREVENTASLHQQEIDTLNADKNRLRDQITERDAEITHWQTQYNQNDRIIRVFMANSRYHMGNIEDLREAVNILMRVPLEGLPIDIVAMAEAIMESALPRLATHYATGGIASFNDGDYDRALIQLEDARLFITPHNPQFAHLLYHLGTLYYRIPARSEEAIEVLVELAALEGFATLPANPWNARRARVADMLENMGVALD